MNKIKTILALLAVLVCGGAWAATPLATWTDFSSVTGNSQVEINSAEGETYKLTVPSENTVSDDGALVIGGNTGITVNYSGSKVVTIELDVSNVPTSDCALITAMIGSQHAVCLAANNGTLSQHWTASWNSDYGSATWPTTGRHTVALTYYGNDNTSATRGTQTYVDGNSAIAVKNGLISTTTNLDYIRLGAQYAGCRLATGMKIHAIRIYNSRLSDAEIAAAYYDHKVPDYTATVTGDCNFSELEWTPALPDDLSMAKLVLTVTGNPTVNFASPVSCGVLEVNGAVKFTTQNNLTATLTIPADSTVAFGTKAVTSGIALVGEGTLKLDPGVGADYTGAAFLPASAFNNFAGTLHVVSGRYQPGAAINSNVKIKVTHGGQIWPSSGTWNNAFEISGRGWKSDGNFVEQNALRIDTAIGESATIKVVDDPDHTPTAIGSTANRTIQAIFTGSGDLELRGAGAMTINEPYHPDFTGKVTSTSDFTLGKNGGLSANSPIEFGSEIVVPALKTFTLNGGNLNGASFADNNKYVVNSKITISNGARLTTNDGAYRFSDVTIPSGATCYTTFKWKKGWLFDALNIPSNSTLQMEVPNDGDDRRMYIGVDGGSVEGTCRIQNAETDACDLWFSPKGEVFANGAIELTGSRASYVVLRDDAQVGSISGAQVGSVFGDGVAARTLTLKNGTTTSAIKDIATGKNADRPISLVIDGAVTMNGSIDGVSGTITVRDCDATIKSMGEYSGTMTLENASRFMVTNPSANSGTISVAGGTLTMAAGFEGRVNVSEGAGLKLVVTEQQMDSGYTASRVTLPENTHIAFVQQDGNAVPNECSGNTMQASGNTWTAQGDNNWSDPANWSASHVPAAGENAVIAIDGPTTINLPAEAVSLNFLAIKGSGSLSFVGSTRVTCATLDVSGTVTASTAQIKPTAVVVNENAVLNYEVLEETSISGVSGLGKVVKTGSAKLKILNPTSTGYALNKATVAINDGMIDFITDATVGDARFRDATVIIGENGSFSNYGWLKIPDAGHTLTIETDVDGKSFMTEDGQHLQGNGTLVKTGAGSLNVVGHIDVTTTVSEGALAMTGGAEIAAVSGAGKVVVPSGVLAKASGVISCVIEGAGLLEIAGDAPTGAGLTALQDASKWTGTILVKGDGNSNNFSGAVASLGNAQSVLRVSGVRAAALGNITTAVTLEVVDNGDVKGFTQQDGSGGNVYKFGALAGNGTFYSNGFQWYADNGAYLFGDAVDFEGTILFANHTKGGFWVVVGDAVPTLPAKDGSVIHACVYVKAGYTLGLGGTVNSITDTNYFAGTLKVQSATAKVQTSAQFVEGSKIDLSKAGAKLTLPATATGTTMVIVGDREITVGDQLIAWESIPEGFTAKLASGSFALEPRETGLYVVNRGPATIVATDWDFNAFTLNGVSTTMIDDDTVEIPSTLVRDDSNEWHATDGTDKLAGHAILANSSMNWKWSIKRMTIGSGVSIYAYGTSGTTISDGTVIDGAGIFSLEGYEALTVNGSVVISCGVDATEGNFKLDENASLTVNVALDAGKVTTAVEGKAVKKVVNADATITYSLVDASPDAPITPDAGEVVIPVVPDAGIAIEPGANVTVPTDMPVENIKVVYGGVDLAKAVTEGESQHPKYVNVAINETTGAVELTTTEAAKPDATAIAMSMPTEGEGEEKYDKVQFTITDPIPGLFYSIVSADGPTDDDFTSGTDSTGIQATGSDPHTTSIDMPPDAKVKYFRVRVKATK